MSDGWKMGGQPLTPEGAWRLLVAALRSGDYQQGHNVLCQVLEEGPRLHCCLGVACDIAVRHKVTQELSTTLLGPGGVSTVLYGQAGVHGSSAVLPQQVQEWLGIDRAVNPVLQLPPYLAEQLGISATSAIELNDDRLATFDQIADAMEFTFLRQDWLARQAQLFLQPGSVDASGS